MIQERLRIHTPHGLFDTLSGKALLNSLLNRESDMSNVSQFSRIDEQKGIIRQLRASIYPTWSRYFSHCTLMEGKLKGTEESFRCLFVENAALAEYIIPRMYGQAPAMLRRSRIWTPRLRTILKTYSNAIDMCIAVLPAGYDPDVKGLVSFKSDMLIGSSIDTSGGPEKIRQRLRLNKKRFCKKMDKNPAFSCRVSTDVEDLYGFYTRMYVPHVRRRFRDLADVDSYEQMQNVFQKGFLLLLDDGSKIVAGALCNVENHTLFVRRTGILDSDDYYIKRGASSAQYYFALKYALENDIAKVDLLGTRPFFHDGVYITKRKWGAEVYLDNESKSSVFFFIPRISSKVAKFFENNPLIIHRGKNLYGLVGTTDDTVLSAEDEKRLHQKYYSPGLKGFVIIRPGSQNPFDIVEIPEDARYSMANKINCQT